MSIGFLIRPAEPDDAEAVAALRKRADGDKHNKYPPLDPTGGDYPTIDQQRHEIEHHDVCFVALMGDKFVGFGLCSSKDQLPGSYAVSLTVDPETRGKGIGTALVSRLIIWAKANDDVETLSCRFARADRSLQRILEDVGFKVVHVGWAYFTQGASYNATDMVMEIR
jgi:GNAT superfamily N-acetyltransferase